MILNEVSQLSLREKFQVMEAIWEDLRGKVQQASAVPAAHQQLLDARRARVVSRVHPPSWIGMK